MDGLYFSLHQSSAHPWSPERRGGHAFEERDSPRRVEVAPRVGSGDFDLLWESGGDAQFFFEICIHICMHVCTHTHTHTHTHLPLSQTHYQNVLFFVNV